MSKKTKKKFTVPEFKTWLEGIMQFQDADWSPNREQWEEIYSKIMDLKEPINREKVSLTDPALDEINGIVYDQIREALSKINSPRPVQQPFYENPEQNIGTPQPQTQPRQPLQSQGPAEELPDLSLKELNRQYEEKQRGIATGQSTTHKLPDRIDNGGPPDDFV